MCNLSIKKFASSCAKSFRRWVFKPVDDLYTSVLKHTNAMLQLPGGAVEKLEKNEQNDFLDAVVPFVLSVNDSALLVQRSCGTLGPQHHRNLVLQLTKEHLSRFPSTTQPSVEPTTSAVFDLVDILDPEVTPPPSSIGGKLLAGVRQPQTVSQFMYNSDPFKAPSPITPNFRASPYDAISESSPASVSEGETFATPY